MRIKLKITTLLLPVSLILSGCFPTLCTNHAGVSGKVIDAESKQPVASASITLDTYSMVKRQAKTSRTLTDADGAFEIQPIQEMCLYIVPMNPYPQGGKVTIHANGYEEVSTIFHSSTLGPGLKKLDTVSLTQSNIKP